MGKHYVPQQYLRGFAADADRAFVWMFDKARSAWTRPAISKAAQQRDYFSPEVESRLAIEIEAPGHVALEELRAGADMSADVRAPILDYVAVMLMRVPRRRRKALELLPQTVSSTIEQTRRELGDLATPENATRIHDLLRQVDDAELKLRSEVPQGVKEFIEDPWPSDRVAAAIHEMCWRLVDVPPHSPLITSDNPAYFFEAYGVGSALAEVTFPVDQHRALMGSHQGAPGASVSLKGTRALAKEINRRVATGADRFVFASAKHPWVSLLATRRAPYLSRIAW